MSDEKLQTELTFLEKFEKVIESYRIACISEIYDEDLNRLIQWVRANYKE